MKMERKKAVVIASLLMVLLASFALVPPASPSPDPESHFYFNMGGTQTSHSELLTVPPSVTTTVSISTPMLSGFNITFSDRDLVTGIVNLTVPAATYVGAIDYEYDPQIGWVRIDVTYPTDGYGWLFTGNGTSPILGDVDCYTFNNNTGVYWLSPSPQAGQLAALPGQFPSPGPDGVAGTADDGFGDGTPDPVGSSILYLRSQVNTSVWLLDHWETMFVYNWTGVWTTAVAYDIVNEPTSSLDGVNSTMVGHPWEYLAGLDNPGKGPVPHGHSKWNAYVTYASSWSLLNTIQTLFGTLNLLVEETQKLVRTDLVIADIDCNELVDIVDVVIAALAFGTKDANLGPDGTPGTGDDKTTADPNFDPRGDVRDDRKLIDIVDIVRIAIDFGKQITP